MIDELIYIVSVESIAIEILDYFHCLGFASSISVIFVTVLGVLIAKRLKQ